MAQTRTGAAIMMGQTRTGAAITMGQTVATPLPRRVQPYADRIAAAQQRLEEAQEEVAELMRELAEELEDEAPELPELPVPRVPEERAGALYDSRHEYLKQLAAHKRFQGKD